MRKKTSLFCSVGNFSWPPKWSREEKTGRGFNVRRLDSWWWTLPCECVKCWRFRNSSFETGEKKICQSEDNGESQKEAQKYFGLLVHSWVLKRNFLMLQWLPNTPKFLPWSTRPCQPLWPSLPFLRVRNTNLTAFLFFEYTGQSPTSGPLLLLFPLLGTLFPSIPTRITPSFPHSCTQRGLLWPFPPSTFLFILLPCHLI